MTDASEETMRAHYAAGDHAAARAIAQQLSGTQGGSDEVRRVLAATDTDRFLTLVGALGLGLVVALVYKYVL